MIADYDGNWISVDGITVGSSVSDLEKAFSTVKVEDIEGSSIIVGSDDIYLVFSVTGGQISSISYYNDNVYLYY